MTADYRNPDEWRLKRFGIPVKLVERSGTFGGLDDVSTAVEKYLVPATSLLAFASGIFPKPITAGNKICQLTSQMPGVPFMRSKRITWKAHVPGKPIDPFLTDTDADSSTYGTVAEVDVEYRSSNQEDEGCIDDPRTFLEITGNTTGEFLHAGGGNCYWAVDQVNTQFDSTLNSDPNPPVTIPVPHTEWNLRWPMIFGPFFEDILVDKLRSRLGKVNETPFEILFNAAPETVMFLGYDYRETPIFTGDTVDSLERALFVEVNMKFVEKHVTDSDGLIRGHNDFWKKGTGWQYLWCGSAEDQLVERLKPVHTLTEMNDLFSTSHGACTFTWDGSEYQVSNDGCFGGWQCPDVPNEPVDIGPITLDCIPP